MSDLPPDEAAAGAAQTDESRESPVNIGRKHKLPGSNRDSRVKKKKESEGESMRLSEHGSDEASVCSAQTDQSREYPPNLSAAPAGTRFQQRKFEGITTDASHLKTSERRSDEASVCPAQTDRSIDYPLNFSAAPAGTSGQTTLISPQKQETLKEFDSKAMAFVKHALDKHKKVLSGKHAAVFEEQEAIVDDELLLECDEETREAALKIALHVLRTMKQDEHIQTLEQSHYGELVLFQRHLKSFLKDKHAILLEVNQQQWPVPLKKIYTKLCLIEGGSGDVNREHEVRLIETAFNRRKSSETVIRTEDIFKPHPKRQEPVKTVLTRGIAGIGKTVLAQKFMLNWAEDKANQDIQLMFSLPFRELNLIQNNRYSLMELLNIFTPGLTGSGIRDLQTYRVLFVLDGLDECRLTLNFKESKRCCDATDPASVDVLLTNLISGNLLPKARLWITTRPAAANTIPPQYIDRVTEIRGFNNLQKEQYFQKKLEDEDLAARVIANIKSSKSLYIMCHVPVFCWISSIVLGRMCAKEGAGGKMPKTLTQMYIHFVTHQTTQMSEKYCAEQQQLDPQEKKKVIMALGKLAFQQLEKGNLIFYEEDLTECGIEVKDASVYSGLCTQVFREESWMEQKVFCFVHLSVQEFLAALYVHVMYSIGGENLLVQTPEQNTRTRPIFKLHRAAVDQALCSDNGHLDLFLRFLLGLSLDSSQGLLTALNIQVDPQTPQNLMETTKYIKEKISISLPPEKYINLFHCLNELKDQSLLEEIQNDLDSEADSVMENRSAAHWSALVFMLLTSPEKPEEIHLKKYSRTDTGLMMLLPAIKASRSAVLNDCNLTADSFRQLSSTLSSSCNELIHLNLSDNNFQDSGIQHLCNGLQSPHCRLKTLKLIRCSLTPRSCEHLASVLKMNSSRLRELDLSDNDIEESGVQHLCSGLGSQACRLETLRLWWCNVTEEGCRFLASAVKSNPLHLRELDLSYNHLGKSGVKLLSGALEEGRCEFTKLRVHHNAERWYKPGLRKYPCKLTLDPDTAHRLLVLSDNNRKVTWDTEQPYPDRPERFDHWAQVLSVESLTGRCYWEVEWKGNWVGIGVTYRGIGRKGPGNDSVMGYNKLSWSLHCNAHGYRAYHDYKSTTSPVPLAGSDRLAVYLDSKQGLLSFFRVSPGRSLTHLHTFCKRFSEPLYAMFRVWGEGSSVRLCTED